MYHLDLLEVFSNLAQSHGRIAEYFGLFYLFIKHFGKDHLKGHRDACLLKVFLEHVGLLLCFSGLVHSLYMNQGYIVYLLLLLDRFWSLLRGKFWGLALRFFGLLFFRVFLIWTAFAFYFFRVFFLGAFWVVFFGLLFFNCFRVILFRLFFFLFLLFWSLWIDLWLLFFRCFWINFRLFLFWLWLFYIILFRLRGFF